MDKSTEEFLKTLNKFRFLKPRVRMGGPYGHAEHFMMVSISDCMKENQKSGKVPPGVTVSQISNQLGATMAAVSKMLRSLEGKGLIIREASDSDRRNVYIRLSEKGEKELREHVTCMETMTDRVITKMGEEDAKQLNELFQKFYIAAKEVIKEGENESCLK